MFFWEGEVEKLLFKDSLIIRLETLAWVAPQKKKKDHLVLDAHLR